jgi:hypothetical protein
MQSSPVTASIIPTEPRNEKVNEKMPYHLVQDLNNLSTQEFEIALEYWMNQFIFPYAAYDESIYPEGQRKPTGGRYKTNHRFNNVPSHRDRALLFACQILLILPWIFERHWRKSVTLMGWVKFS